MRGFFLSCAAALQSNAKVKGGFKGGILLLHSAWRSGWYEIRKNMKKEEGTRSPRGWGVGRKKYHCNPQVFFSEAVRPTPHPLFGFKSLAALRFFAFAPSPLLQIPAKANGITRFDEN